MKTTMNETDDYTKLTAALADYTERKNRLAVIEAGFQEAIQELIGECYREDFMEHADALGETEATIELLALRHPEWFEKTKTIKTPFGSVATRSSTKIEVPNEDATIALIELRGEAGEPFLRTRKYLSIEALEALDDFELKRLKCRRVTSEKITITPAKVDLGKTVKKAEKGGGK